MISDQGDVLRVLFLTRKHPPAVGGMEKLSAELVQAVARLAETRTIAWGGSQKWLVAFLPYCLARAAVEIIRWRPDVIHLGDPIMCTIGLPLSRAFGIPAVVTVHGLDVTWERRWYQRLVVPLVGRCSRAICISRHTLSQCEARGIAHHASVVAPGLAPDSLPSAGEAERETVAQMKSEACTNPLVLLTVGRLVARKGVAHFVQHTLPKIVDVRPDVLYWVVGDGPDREAVIRAIEDRSMTEHVRLFGRVSDKMLGAIYEASDLFVMPNVPIVGDMEGFGLVAVEANLARLPVVASALEGITDAVSHGQNGHLVPWEDAEAMASAILSLADRDELERSGERAREHALTRFAWPAVAQKYCDIFAEVADRDVPA
jgi:phosphatidylinositol alpha-1,6-mannosyltransferase